MRKEPPKHARLAILCAGAALLAAVTATIAGDPPHLTPAELRKATGGATLCEQNPFCWGISYRPPYSTSGEIK